MNIKLNRSNTWLPVCLQNRQKQRPQQSNNHNAPETKQKTFHCDCIIYYIVNSQSLPFIVQKTSTPQYRTPTRTNQKLLLNSDPQNLLSSCSENERNEAFQITKILLSVICPLINQQVWICCWLWSENMLFRKRVCTGLCLRTTARN